MINLVKGVLISFIVAYSLVANAQVVDNFSDGNITTNPTWLGNTTDFIVNEAYQLQLFMEVEDDSSSFLAVPNLQCLNSEWRCWVRQKFAPSANNFGRIYLVSDKEDLRDTLNGYFLQLGEAGSSDAITLFRQDGMTLTPVCRGTEGAIAGSFIVGLKVVREATGLWKLFADMNGGENYILQAEGVDDLYQTTAFFGFYAQFTMSNDQGFYYDNIYVGDIVEDTIPPEVEKVTPLSNRELSLVFSEYIPQSSATVAEHYQLSTGVMPLAVVYQDSAVLLQFENIFPSGETISITVSGITDIAGNEMVTGSFDFLWYETAPWEVVFNELMVDPNPPVYLPNYEYVELKNLTSYPIQMGGWRLVIGQTEKQFPQETWLLPEGYLLLCDNDAEEELSSFGELVLFSSMSLSNIGQQLRLFNRDSILMAEVAYTDEWYRNPDKDNGGWSLELIDPYAPCLGATNWMASENQDGGTPGEENSVFNSLEIEITLSRVKIVDSVTIAVTFNQLMDSLEVIQCSSWQRFPEEINPVSIAISEEQSFTYILSFSALFEPGGAYTLFNTTPFHNCIGEEFSQGNEYHFYMPETPSLFDVVISEVMADPAPVVDLPNAEYIELFNRSDKVLSVENWRLVLGDSEKCLSDVIVLPDEYVVVVKEEYASMFTAYGNVVTVPSLGISNQEMPLFLRDKEGELIHQFYYNIDFHSNSNKAEGGWSLEMIDYDNPCGKGENWKSSKSSSGGTPAAQNSVAKRNRDAISPLLIRNTVIDDQELSLYFNEYLDSASVVNPMLYSVIPDLGNPDWVVAQDFGFTNVLLHFNTPLQDSLSYHLNIVADSICDCVHNSLAAVTDFPIQLPLPIDSNDVVINEVLFDPYGDGKDYIELFNRSDKCIDLSALALSIIDEEEEEIKSTFLPAFILLPQTYCCLTRSVHAVEEYYLVPDERAMFQVEDLVDIPTASGTILLSKKEQVAHVIDGMHYDASMHNPILKEVEGVSLERVSVDVSSESLTNWQSASSSVGYGTPGYKNSTSYAANGSQSSVLALSPDIFSPDGDGYDDILVLTIATKTVGNSATIKIFNAMGAEVITLVNNEYIGREATYFWNGMSASRKRVPIGRYIILLELFDNQGNCHTEKATTVVAERL